MAINVGDLVKVKTYATKPEYVLSTSGRKNLRESPLRGNVYSQQPRPDPNSAVSAYLDFVHQGKIGVVTHLNDPSKNNDDMMWTIPIVTILLDTGELLRLPKDDLEPISENDLEKTHANLAEGYIVE